VLINPLLAAAIIEFVVGGFIFIADDHVAIANRGAAVVDLGLVKTTSRAANERVSENVREPIAKPMSTLRDTFYCSTRYKRHRLGTPLSR